MNSSLLVNAAKPVAIKVNSSLGARQMRLRSKHQSSKPRTPRFIDRIRTEIAAGTYDTDEKMTMAIDRLMALVVACI